MADVGRRYAVKVKTQTGRPYPRDTFWMRIGVATEMANNGTILMTISALPLNWDGEAKLFPEKEKDDFGPPPLGHDDGG